MKTYQISFVLFVLTIAFNIKAQSQINISNWKTYECDGIKSQGLKFRLKYPADWTAENGEHLSIIKKFSPMQGVFIGISVSKMDKVATESDIDKELTFEAFKSINDTYLSKYGAKYITYFGNRTSFIDGTKAIIYECAFEVETIRAKESRRNITYITAYKNYLITFEGRVTVDGDIKTENDFIAKYMNVYRPYFNEIVNSFVNISKSESTLRK
jgi:hypothetical protein